MAPQLFTYKYACCPAAKRHRLPLVLVLVVVPFKLLSLNRYIREREPREKQNDPARAYSQSASARKCKCSARLKSSTRAERAANKTGARQKKEARGDVKKKKKPAPRGSDLLAIWLGARGKNKSRQERKRDDRAAAAAVCDLHCTARLET